MMMRALTKFFSHTLSVTLVALFLASTSNAQDIRVNSGFLTDSLKIGEETAFYLSAHYPSKLSVLFPDSTYKFSSFEYLKKRYFPTRTENGVSVDSAVYYFTTFEVDRVQRLQLPVYSVVSQDCTVFESLADSVLITQLVAKVPDSLTVDKLPLKMNTAYQRVFFEFNTWVVIIVVGALLIIAILVWIFFGKKIARHFRIKRLRKMHAEFMNRYNAMLAQLQTAFSSDGAETTVSAWKKYMEKLESQPYTKLTTKETLQLIHDPALVNDLREIDRSIYGAQATSVNHFERLRAFADERFAKRLREVQHG